MKAMEFYIVNCGIHVDTLPVDTRKYVYFTISVQGLTQLVQRANQLDVEAFNISYGANELDCNLFQSNDYCFHFGMYYSDEDGRYDSDYWCHSATIRLKTAHLEKLLAYAKSHPSDNQRLICQVDNFDIKAKLTTHVSDDTEHYRAFGKITKRHHYVHEDANGDSYTKTYTLSNQ